MSDAPVKVKTTAEMRDIAVKVLKPYRAVLMEAAQLYGTTYPAEKTPAEVLNAVTVSVGYLPFFGMVLAMEACFASKPEEKPSEDTPPETPAP